MSKQWQKLTDMNKPQDVQAEMLKKYKNTVLGIVVDDTTHYGYYSGIDDDGYHVFRSLKDKITFKLSDDTEYEVFIPNIKRGFYNTPNGVVYFKRRAARQFRRGINMDSHTIYPFIHHILSGLTQNRFEFNISFVLYNDNKTTEMDNAIKQLRDNVDYALNTDFAITVDHTADSDRKCLYYQTAFVGFVEDKQITVVNPAFYQEVFEALPEIAPKYSLKVLK